MGRTKQPSILVFDNYDSFTFNLVHYLIIAGAEVEVVRADRVTASDALRSGADAFLISPGPGRPEESGQSLSLVAACAAARAPLLGVCLGHQAIAMHFGGVITGAPRPVHGKPHQVSHDGRGIFSRIPDPFEAIRYHSLTIDATAVPVDLVVNACCSDGTIQGIRHRHLPIYGVQFHPESAGSRFGHQLLANFVDLARDPANGEL